MKIALLGYGKMGRLIEELALERNHVIFTPQKRERYPEIEIFIDFSHSSCVLDHVRLACQLKKPILIGTTGWQDHLSEVQELVRQHRIAALFSANFSIGMFIFHRIVESAAKLVNHFPNYDLSGQESHHVHKKDIPSGTALHLAKILLENCDRKKSLNVSSDPETLNFTSLRCGNIPGTHTIILDSAEDTLTLTHEARNREGFAKGALACAEWLADQKDRKNLMSFEDFMASYGL